MFVLLAYTIPTVIHDLCPLNQSKTALNFLWQFLEMEQLIILGQLPYFYFQGINPAHENCTRSWNLINDILSKLKSCQMLYSFVNEDDMKCLEKIINDCKIYIKNVFRHEIRMHSDIKV